MKFIPIKRAQCKKCRQFAPCAFSSGKAICYQCDNQKFAEAAEAHKEAWLKGEC